VVLFMAQRTGGIFGAARCLKSRFGPGERVDRSVPVATKTSTNTNRWCPIGGYHVCLPLQHA